MPDALHRSLAELELGLEDIRQSSANDGSVKLIVCRPAVGERQVLEQGVLTLEEGLVGDSWSKRTRRSSLDAATYLEMQLTMMNARVIALVAQSEDRWPLAGDQLYVDFDLSQANLPAGARLEIGSAVIEVSAVPHTGCRLFFQRFGSDAVKFVNSPLGKQLRLRGLNARVVRPGIVRPGVSVRKISP